MRALYMPPTSSSSSSTCSTQSGTMKTTKTCRSRERDEPYRLKKRTQNICRRFVHGAILVILQIFKRLPKKL